MLKFAILLFNTLALLIYQFLFTEGVTVTQKVPSSAKADSEFTVELRIQKGSTVGFAKLQQELPEGFTAVEDKNNGASFTFSNQTVKFIWMSLPNDAEFTISYKVKVAAGTSGDQSIGGKFSYVTDNAKQTSDIEPATITIGDGDVAIAKTTDTETSDTEDATEETETDTEAEVKTVKTTKSPDASPFNCVRTVPATAAGEFTVEITVNKANLTGFAKLMEVLPYGFTASAVELAGASFSFADQKARFIWVSLPSTPEFKISYKVKVADVTGDQIIDGVFSYIENDETQKFVVPTSTITISGDGASQDIVKTEDTTEDTTDENEVKEVKKETYEDLAADNIPTPQGNINYSVQILALRKAKSANAVANIYNINETVKTESAEGFRKYTVGSHSEYKSARDARETFKPKGVIAPFVTAYNRGRRVTVQEALMVSNQKWYR